MLCYFACGSLPWQGLKAATDKERNELLKEQKSSLSGKDVCGHVPPSEFATYINYTRAQDPTVGAGGIEVVSAKTWSWRWIKSERSFKEELMAERSLCHPPNSRQGLAPGHRLSYEPPSLRP